MSTPQATQTVKQALLEKLHQEIDGAQWLWKLADAYFVSAIQILDWHHLAEHVHKAANTLWGEGKEKAKIWASRLKDDLWEGRGATVLELVRTERTKTRSPAKREALHELETYLEHNLGRIDYPRYRALGLPVGSGRWKLRTRRWSGPAASRPGCGTGRTLARRGCCVSAQHARMGRTTDSGSRNYASRHKNRHKPAAAPCSNQC
jgi:hypothetical protein